MQVVDLAGTRDLLQAWETVRVQILKGNIRGWALCLAEWGGAETVSFAGSYAHCGESAASAALRMSWEITKASDPTGTSSR